MTKNSGKNKAILNMSAPSREIRHAKAMRQVGPREIAPARTSEPIEGYLQERILSGEWPSGFKAPSEATLCQQFGVSRTAVREAIRSLQGRGLLKTVNGSGSYVAGAGLENVSQALNVYSTLSSDDKSFDELLELRMAIEGEAAAKVASNRSSDDWQCLDARLAAMDAARGLEEFAVLDIDFHIELLRLSRNGLFASLGNALHGRWVGLAFQAFHKAEGLREATMTEHREIFRAVVNGEPTAAREAGASISCWPAAAGMSGRALLKPQR